MRESEKRRQGKKRLFQLDMPGLSPVRAVQARANCSDCGQCQECAALCLDRPGRHLDPARRMVKPWIQEYPFVGRMWR